MALHGVYAPRQPLAVCSPLQMLASFEATGMCILQDVFLPLRTKRAQEEMLSILLDDERRSLLPRYNIGTGVGYVSPGMDGLIHTGPLRTRRAYDYIPTANREWGLPGLILRPLYDRLCYIGEFVLDMVGSYLEVPLRDTHGGEHMLKSVLALNSDADPKRAIFPEHRDFSMLTLFVGGAPPGLQVLLGDEWRDVTLEPHEVLLGAGSFFRRLHPVTVLQHRVMATVPNRFSFSCFVEAPGYTLLPGGETVAEAIRRVRRQAFTAGPH